MAERRTAASRRPGAAAAALLLAGVLGFLAARLPVPWLLVEPGIAVPVRVVVEAGGPQAVSSSGGAAVPPPAAPAAAARRGATRSGPGSFWLVTVAARPARLGDAWPALWDRRRQLVPAAALGGPTLAEVEAAQRAALQASQEAAAAAAAALLGIRPVPGLRFVLPPEVAGPSGGLVLGLAAVDALAPGDLAGGLRVGATGTLSPEGRVGAVEGVALKWLAAAEAGLDVLFVPANQPLAGRSGPVVVPVPTLGTAVRWLCQHGGQGPPCP
ncbi:secreted protein [Thermaerobacter marianensis DSM 12885]|uniref:Secreted protein n=1 Tax=Thermaerobacter marianensis (strain ATCC 700841 / DSM 12885 / JCM 10246 / 7p75a) TaxID=644966 RepID=E6SJC3_THEM7|nr:hypothetical protein [Thermaerobacter marianensis]ADU51051.1 secreted protein [Thermaerobacter marianensis DSM 12885]